MRRSLAGKSIEIWGDGSVIRDYLYVDDVVEALILSATHEGAGRIFNVGSGEGRSLKDIVMAIDRLIGSEIPLEYRPGRPVDVPVSVLDTAYAARELGWRSQTVFDDGLRSTIAWMKSVGA